MPFFRFSPQLCTRAFSRHFNCRAPFVYVVPFLNLLLFCDCFPELAVFSVKKIKSDIVFAWAQAAILRSSGHSVKEIANFNKTVRWVIKWSKREYFEDKPRSGRPSVLTNAARKSVEEAKHKRNNSTREIAKNRRQKNIEVLSITVWRYMTRKRWKAFKRKKIPLYTQNWQQKIGTIFYLQMSVLNIFSSTLIQKTILFGLAGMWCSSSFPSEAKCEGDGVGWLDGSWANKVTHATHRLNLNFSVLRQPNPWERSETVDIKASGDRWPDKEEVV